MAAAAGILGGALVWAETFAAHANVQAPAIISPRKCFKHCTASSWRVDQAYAISGFRNTHFRPWLPANLNYIFNYIYKLDSTHDIFTMSVTI